MTYSTIVASGSHRPSHVRVSQSCNLGTVHLAADLPRMSENGAPAIPTLQKQEVKPVLPKRSYSSPSLHFHHSAVYGDPPLRALRAEGIYYSVI